VLENAGAYRWRSEAAFKNWLFTAAMNKIVDRRRFHRRGKRDHGREVLVGPPSSGAGARDPAAAGDAPHPGPTPSRDLMQREAAGRIERALQSLPEQYREVLVLSRIVGLTYAQIGAQTGRTETAVRGLVARGMARLAQLLDEQDAG
jgi:RNA polymerase sigma-70 factor (ECF subfamily)